MFPPGTPQHTFCWELVRIGVIEDDKVLSTRKRPDEDDRIGIHLYVEEPCPLTLDLYVNLKVDHYKDKLFTQPGDQCHDIRLRNLSNVNRSWGYGLSQISDMIRYLDPEGSLNLKVAADFYLATDGVAEILAQDDVNNDGTCVVASEVESQKKRTDILLSQVASLLGDEVTSDVLVSVVHMESKVQIGTF